jgi:hypothetical protein
MRHRQHQLVEELRIHFPFTVFSVAAGLMLLGMFNFISVSQGTRYLSSASRDLFHVFHPLHMLFSTIATTAMFWRHEKRILKAAIIGVIGSVGICGLSDIIIPYLSGYLLGVRMDLHICVIEHAQIVIPFIVMGLLVGFIVPEKTESTIFSHAIHVLVSSMASILYLVSFGLVYWVQQIGMIFIYMTFAVIIPCCTSDIIFPLLLTSNKGARSHPHHA